MGRLLTQNPVTAIGSPPITERPRVYRAPASVYGEYGPAYAPRPAYVERAPVYPERYYARERYYGEGRDYALEYAPRPPLSVPYRSRARCDDGYGRWTYCD